MNPAAVLGAFDLTGQVAVVTGATRGLGREAALALAGAGADVAITGRRIEPLEGLAQEIERLDRGRATTFLLDVTDYGAIDATIAGVGSELGPVTILLNNAGVQRQAMLAEMEPDDWTGVLETNLGSVIACSRAFIRQSEERLGGSIINVSSIGAAVGVAGQSVYCASKGGVASLTRALAVELARHSVRVNAIAPGYFATDMPEAVITDPAQKEKLLRQVPLRRLGEPWEIGPLVVYLASAASRFMTGSVIYMDGGFTAK